MLTPLAVFKSSVPLVIVPLPSAVMLPLSKADPRVSVSASVNAYGPLRLASLKFLSVTFSNVEPVTDELLAEIVVTPRATPVATPLTSMVAAVNDELQLTNWVRSWVVPSANLAEALKGCFPPNVTATAEGETAIETGGITAKAFEPFIPPEVAVMFAAPPLSAVTIPVASTVATLGSSVDHTAVAVRSLIFPSLSVPVAVNAPEFPTFRFAFGGPTLIDTNVGVGVPPPPLLLLDLLLHPASSATKRPAVANPTTTCMRGNRIIVNVLWLSGMNSRRTN